MGCFDNIVALKELCPQKIPFTGVYLNDVGINSAFVESIITTDYPNIQNFIDSKINHSIRVVESMLMSKIAPYVKPGSLLEGQRIGYTQPDLNTKSMVPGNLTGIQVTLNSHSQFIEQTISSISLQLSQTINDVEIYVYDLYQGLLLDTFTIDALANEIITIFPQKAYYSEGRPIDLFIGYSTTNITTDSIFTTANQTQCCGTFHLTNTFLTGRGVYIPEVSQKTSGNCIQNSHTSGLSITYGLCCNMSGWLCQYANALKIPLAYHIAAEINLHAINNSLNSRSSNNANVNRDAIVKRYEWYMDQFNGIMKGVIDNMVIPKNTICFICKSPVKHTISIP